MSKYTTQLRYICEVKAGLYESVDDYNAVIDASYSKIIHPDVQLFDAAYEPILYKKIIKHYYFDEIGHETVARFLMRLNLKLEEILPYYNELYRSAALEINPLYDVDYHVEGNKEDNGNTHSLRTDNLNQLRTDDLANHGESVQYDLFSDTPEGSLTGVDQENYLTNARKISSEADGTNTGTQSTANTGTQDNDSTIHNVNEYFEHVYGKRGGASYAALIKEWRETFLNIDMMIIEELRPLFMQVF